MSLVRVGQAGASARKLRALALGSTASIAALVFVVGSPVHAQDQSSDQGNIETVVVTGFAKSLESSIAVKRTTDSIVEALSAEEIGKLPDVSIAESLGRLPGLATQRVDGRGQVISIRGLGPDLSTALLNGREQVSTSDNRGVEFDQYPAEILSGAVVYKTPDAKLIGQGLAGTVDLQTIRPLEKGTRVISANVRGEFNEGGSLNPDSTSKGIRGSATFVDQFANDTLGVALSIAYQSTPTQSKKFNSWGYPTIGCKTSNADGSCATFRKDVNGNDADPSAFVIGGSKPFAQSNTLQRVGLISTVEYRPNAHFETTLDFYYSNFTERVRLRGIEFPLFWSSAQLRDGFTVTDGLVTDGVFDGVVGVVRNDFNKRDAQLYGTGWNAKYHLNEDWTFETDLSYSRANRHDSLIESYSGTGYNKSGVTDSLGFRQESSGRFQYHSILDYTDTNLLVLTDPQGWGAGSGVVQAGFINAPDTEDELTHLRGEVEHTLNFGLLQDIEIGVDASRRDKSRVIDQDFLTLPGTTTLPGGKVLVGGASAPIPQAALLGTRTGIDFLGIPGQVTYDPLYLLNNGFYNLQPVALSSFATPQNWKVREDVLVGYAQVNVDGAVATIPVTGNFGLQVVYTDQSSSGFRVQAGTATVTSGSTNVVLLPITDGDTYTRFLPSLNLSFHLSDNTVARLGAARTLARARMDQLNASLSLSTNETHRTSTDPSQSFFSASGGNPKLKPTIADAVDLSLEHYFGGGLGYVALAGFYKHFEDFVNPSDGFIFDFKDFVNEFTAPGQAPPATTLGTVSGPTNNGDGNLKGFEATLSLPLEAVYEPLAGFGLITSGSYTESRIVLGDNPQPITLPGLSRWVINSTVYYEKSGFEARISHRFRSSFLAEVSGISATRIFREARSDSVFDAQIGYTFQDGSLEGLSITFQANNLTDRPFTTFDPRDPRLVIDDQRFGRTYTIGVSYTLP